MSLLNSSDDLGSIVEEELRLPIARGVKRTALVTSSAEVTQVVSRAAIVRGIRISQRLPFFGVDY